MGTVVVRYVRGLQSEEGQLLSGQASFSEHRLNLNTEARDEWTQRALCRLYYHEWTHFALEAAGLGIGSLFTKDQVEALCDAISTARMIEEMGL